MATDDPANCMECNKSMVLLVHKIKTQRAQVTKTKLRCKTDFKPQMLTSSLCMKNEGSEVIKLVSFAADL